jgi:hypothetical protein
VLRGSISKKWTFLLCLGSFCIGLLFTNRWTPCFLFLSSLCFFFFFFPVATLGDFMLSELVSIIHTTSSPANSLESYKCKFLQSDHLQIHLNHTPANSYNLITCKFTWKKKIDNFIDYCLAPPMDTNSLRALHSRQASESPSSRSWLPLPSAHPSLPRWSMGVPPSSYCPCLYFLLPYLSYSE